MADEVGFGPVCLVWWDPEKRVWCTQDDRRMALLWTGSFAAVVGAFWTFSGGTLGVALAGIAVASVVGTAWLQRRQRRIHPWVPEAHGWRCGPTRLTASEAARLEPAVLLVLSPLKVPRSEQPALVLPNGTVGLAFPADVDEMTLAAVLEGLRARL